MAGRPPKPVNLIKLEKKSHRTKAELETREKAEKQLLTGRKMKAWPEVRANELAKKEFNRIKKLLEIIGHNDALHEAVINRYCLLTAECFQLEETKATFERTLEEAEAPPPGEEIKWMDYMKMKMNLQGQVLACDKAIMAKRKMLLQIEKENIMTIMAALRSIPKKPEEKKDSPMAEYLRKKREGKSG